MYKDKDKVMSTQRWGGMLNIHIFRLRMRLRPDTTDWYWKVMARFYDD